MNESIFKKIWNYDFGRADHYNIPDRVRCGTRDVAVCTDFPAVERLIFLR